MNKRVKHLEEILLSGGQPLPRARLKKMAVPNAVRVKRLHAQCVLLLLLFLLLFFSKR